MGISSSLWVEGPTGLQATQGSDSAASPAIHAVGVPTFHYSGVDALCSSVDDDLRAVERRSPLLGLLAIVAFWAVVLAVGDALIATFS